MNETTTTNTSTEGYIYVEAFDTKLLNVRTVLKPRCPTCKNWGNHRPECKDYTIRDAEVRLKRSEEREAWAREKAATWLNECRKMHGKIAMLKHENRVLRERQRSGKLGAYLAMSDSQMRLQFGEMTAQELRTVRAVLGTLW